VSVSRRVIRRTERPCPVDRCDGDVVIEQEIRSFATSQVAKYRYICSTGNETHVDGHWTEKIPTIPGVTPQ
jgi:hypothetical protein